MHRDELERMLEQLEAEARTLSLRRRKLHERIALYPDDTGELQRREREISLQRRELHERIDELRAERAGLDGEPVPERSFWGDAA